MIGDPSLVCFAWLVIPNCRVIGYVYLRHAQLDVLIMVVITSPL
jgi:hypothetical protein